MFYNYLELSNRAKGKISAVSFAADKQNNAVLVSDTAAARYKIQELIRSDTLDANGSTDTVVIHLSYLKYQKIHSHFN